MRYESAGAPGQGLCRHGGSLAPLSSFVRGVSPPYARACLDVQSSEGFLKDGANSVWYGRYLAMEQRTTESAQREPPLRELSFR